MRATIQLLDQIYGFFLHVKGPRDRKIMFKDYPVFAAVLNAYVQFEMLKNTYILENRDGTVLPSLSALAKSYRQENHEGMMKLIYDDDSIYTNVVESLAKLLTETLAPVAVLHRGVSIKIALSSMSHKSFITAFNLIRDSVVDFPGASENLRNIVPLLRERLESTGENCAAFQTTDWVDLSGDVPAFHADSQPVFMIAAL